MRISSVRVENYKCFLDSGEIKLGPSFNVFVGRNDAGKSALVEALTLAQGSKPHRSLATLPSRESQANPVSTTHLTYELSPGDLHDCLTVQPHVLVPLGADSNDSTMRRFHSAINAGGGFVAVWEGNSPTRGWLESMGEPQSQNYVQCRNTSYPTGLQLAVQGSATVNAPGFGGELAAWLRARSYAFRAERMNVGECPLAGSQVLLPNAANLPDVLNQLSSTNLFRYQRLMAHVRTILPHITHITAPSVANQVARILVWSVPLNSERDDLAIPLNESGTGIGQVLAILYVVVTSDSPKVIIIDEPQSFLHPGAVRKLLESLRGYPRHQYVITTHAPVALTTTESDRLFLVRREESASTVVPIDPNSQDDLRTFLTEVGARLGDVFGADSILWVEGKTEETCFPDLIRRLAGTPLRGVQILGVISTGELGAKLANRVYDIYSRLSGGTSLLPPAQAFVFDREGRSATDRADIDRKSGGLVRWLPRRMYENYLLEPLAISTVLNSEDTNRSVPVTADQVRAWLDQKKADRRYFGSSEEPSTSASAKWQERVDGAMLLRDLFDEISERRLKYEKVKHGLLLTRFLIENPTTELLELAQMLSTIVTRTA